MVNRQWNLLVPVYAEVPCPVFLKVVLEEVLSHDSIKFYSVTQMTNKKIKEGIDYTSLKNFSTRDL